MTSYEKGMTSLIRVFSTKWDNNVRDAGPLAIVLVAPIRSEFDSANGRPESASPAKCRAPGELDKCKFLFWHRRNQWNACSLPLTKQHWLSLWWLCVGNWRLEGDFRVNSRWTLGALMSRFWWTLTPFSQKKYQILFQLVTPIAIDNRSTSNPADWNNSSPLMSRNSLPKSTGNYALSSTHRFTVAFHKMEITDTLLHDFRNMATLKNF